MVSQHALQVSRHTPGGGEVAGSGLGGSPGPHPGQGSPGSHREGGLGIPACTEADTLHSLQTHLEAMLLSDEYKPARVVRNT